MVLETMQKSRETVTFQVREMRICLVLWLLVLLCSVSSARHCTSFCMV
jgi:hypothetical protein